MYALPTWNVFLIGGMPYSHLYIRAFPTSSANNDVTDTQIINLQTNYNVKCK